eukprot:1340939-Amphidinium_carterae.4
MSALPSVPAFVHLLTIVDSVLHDFSRPSRSLLSFDEAQSKTRTPSVVTDAKRSESAFALPAEAAASELSL